MVHEEVLGIRFGNNKKKFFYVYYYIVCDVINLMKYSGSLDLNWVSRNILIRAKTSSDFFLLFYIK